MNRPIFLLLATGAALGLNFPLGKLAMAAGIAPALWAAVISLGAGLAMLFIVTVTEWKNPSRTSTTYFAIVSGFLSYVVPNALTYAVIPKIGSGLAAIMFALSPVVTALFSLLLRVRPPNLISIFGIAVGLAGVRCGGGGPLFRPPARGCPPGCHCRGTPRAHAKRSPLRHRPCVA